MFISRQQELQWIERQIRLSPLLLINGVRGVGKTQLVKEWLQKSGLRFQWLTMERFKELSESMGCAGMSTEQALEQAPLRWKNCDVIIWDELHLLAPNVRRTLFSFLKSAHFLPKQIFLSDEELEEVSQLSLDIAQKKLAPFQEAEISAYLTSIDEAHDEKLVSELKKSTGGVPLLLRLWAQDKEAQNHAWHSRLQIQLSDIERVMMGFATVLNRPFTSKELQALVPDFSHESLAQLQRKCLLERLPSSPDSFMIPSYVRGLYVQELSSEENRTLSAKICSLYQSSQAPHFEYLLHAVRSGKTESISAAMDASLLDRLEHLRREDLEEFSALLQLLDDTKYINALKHLLMRFRMRAHFLLGEREAAIVLGEKHALIMGETLLDDGGESFLLELVQMLNRLGRAEAARAWSAKVGVSKGSAFLFLIEQAVSWLPAEPMKALEILGPIFSSREFSSAQDVVKAQANFQWARAHDLSDKQEEAEAAYRRALDFYRQAEKPYFAAVTMLNLCWIALHRHDWAQLAKFREELGSSAARHGYHYVLAGLEIIEATESRHTLQFGRALQKIESAIRRLGQSAPRMARIDALAEYGRILNSLGLRSQTERILQQMKSLLPQTKDATFEKRLRHLEQELNLSNSSADAVLDKIERSNDVRSEKNFIFALQRGIEPSRFEPAAANSPLIELARLEYELTKQLQDAQSEEAWHTIAHMERLLLKSTEPLGERIALQLLQAALVKEKETKQTLLSRAELELRRWGSDAASRAPLEAWLRALSSDSKISEQIEWAKTHAGDRERWSRWWRAFEREAVKPWVMISSDGRMELEHKPELSTRTDLYVEEFSSEVFWKGLPVEELLRRHALRKFLVLLLEVNPEGADKSMIASVIWGEQYNPSVHDARIYTSIQRLRTLFGDAASIQNWNGGYRWNPKFTFALVRRQEQGACRDSRYQNLILQALERASASGRRWVGRSELVEITRSSEATVKRELTKLLSAAYVTRQGKGRSVVYGLKRISA